MMFIIIWVWSFVITMFTLIYNCYKNPGKMYLDVLILFTIIVAIPGVAAALILSSAYSHIFIYKSKESREELKEKVWSDIEDIHEALQVFKN